MVAPCASSPPQAFHNGVYLDRVCSSEAPELQLECATYVLGAYDGIKASSGWASKQICEPANITGRQLLGVVRAYLRERPENMHFGGGEIVWDALRRAFPCK